MSYPDPSRQPPWQPQPQPGQAFPPPMGPGQPPYGGHYAAAPPPPAGGRGRAKWLIPAAAGVAVAVMAGTVWATISLVSFGGPQPESVLPGSAFGFGKVDLDIDGSQAVDLLNFVDKLPDEMSDEFDDVEEDDTSAPFAETFAQSYDLDESEVEEWIGQKVGVAYWNTDHPDSTNSDGVGHAIALAVEDAGAADALFGELTRTHDVHHEMVDDFVVFTDDPAGIEDYNDQMETHGDLESDDTYSGDLGSVPSGSIALAWSDLGAMSDNEAFANEFAAEFGTSAGLAGRMTAAFRVTGDYLEARMDVFGFEVEGTDLSWAAGGSGTAVEAMGDLPEDTTVALGGSGLDQMLRTAWENDELPLFDEGDRREMESALNSIGAPLPEGFTSLLGTSTAFGLSDLDLGSMNSPYGPAMEPSLLFRAVGGDERALQGFVDEVVATPYSSTPAPRVRSEGDAVTVSSGNPGGGALSQDQVFQQTMADLDDAVMAGFVDLRRLLTRDEVEAPDQWGAVGLGLSVTEGGERAVVELRWAPSGG